MALSCSPSAANALIPAVPDRVTAVRIARVFKFISLLPRWWLQGQHIKTSDPVSTAAGINLPANAYSSLIKA